MRVRLIMIYVLYSTFILDLIYGMTLSKDARFIISASRDKTVKIFDRQGKREVYQFASAHTGTSSYKICLIFFIIDQIRMVELSSDNRFLASVSYDKSIKVFDQQSRSQIHCLTNIHNSND